MGLYKNNSGVLAPIAGTPTDRLDALTNNTVKNLLNISNCDSSFNGVVVTKNSDGTITLSGTYGGSTGNWIYLGEYILKAGTTYIVSGSGKISSDDGIIGGLTEKWAGSKMTTGIATELYGDGQSYTPETDQLLYFGIRMVNGTNYDGLIYKPMLRLASIKDNSFEPYAMTNAELTQKVNIPLTKYDTNSNLGINSSTICGRLVEFNFNVSDIALTANVWNTIATFPSQYAPSKLIQFVGIIDDNSGNNMAIALLRVTSDGKIEVRPNSATQKCVRVGISYLI